MKISEHRRVSSEAAGPSDPASGVGLVAPFLCRLRDASVRRLEQAQSFVLEVPFLEIHPGDFLVAFGPSGCGKSTLLDLLGLVLLCERAAEFVLNFGDRRVPRSVLGLAEPDLAHLRGRQVGRILQSGGLLPFLTCEQNILLPSRIFGQPRHPGELEELAERLDIRDQLRKRPHALSGGQLQRVAIARALLHQPALVLADEPTASVDRSRGAEIFQLFHELAQERRVTVIVATHDLELAEAYEQSTLTFAVQRDGAEVVRARCQESKTIF